MNRHFVLEECHCTTAQGLGLRPGQESHKKQGGVGRAADGRAVAQLHLRAARPVDRDGAAGAQGLSRPVL